MNLKQLAKYCKEKIELFPNLKRDILDFYSLANDEVEEGESEDNECELAVSSIDELIKEEQ